MEGKKNANGKRKRKKWKEWGKAERTKTKREESNLEEVKRTLHIFCLQENSVFCRFLDVGIWRRRSTKTSPGKERFSLLLKGAQNGCNGLCVGSYPSLTLGRWTLLRFIPLWGASFMGEYGWTFWGAYAKRSDILLLEFFTNEEIIFSVGIKIPSYGAFYF